MEKTQFDTLMLAITGLDTKLSAKIDDVDKRLSIKINNVETKLCAKIDQVNTRLDKIETSLSIVAQQTANTVKDVADLKVRVTKLEGPRTQ